MFKYLVDDYWKEFFKTVKINGEEKTIHDGLKFEKLAETLLKQMYQNEDITWSPTQITNDGNHDFYAVDRFGNILWAECKNYAKSIELKTIASTIVMAQINCVSEILFFSYSKINKNTRQKLTIYASQNSKKVYFYDDSELEKLIFRYREVILPVFFPNFNQNQLIDFDCRPYSFIKSGVGICVSTEDSKFTDVICAQLNDIIYVGVGVFSRTPNNDIDIQIGIENENDLLNIELLDSRFERKNIINLEINDILQPMAARFYTFFYRISVYNESIKLPDIYCKFSIDDIIEKNILFTPTVKVDSLFLAGLMGSTYQEILDNFSKKFFVNNYLKVLYLKGKSGVGKTRMLNEFTSVLIKNNYQVINFLSTPGDNTDIHVIKELIYKLYNLSEELIIESLKEPLTYSNTFGDDLFHIINLLQSIFNNGICKLEEYESFLFEKLMQTKIAVLLDNIQFGNDILINFLAHFFQYANNSNRINQSIFIITQNTDYTESTNLKELVMLLKIISEGNLSNILLNYLEGFEQNQALGFFKAIVSFPDDSLDDILLKLIKRANYNPKLILEITKYLRQKKIISVKDNNLFIANYNKFITTLQNFPLNENNIISQRWYTYIHKFNDNEQKKQIILLSAIHFLGYVTMDLCEKLFLPVSYLSNLSSIGFIKKDTVGAFHLYCFEHDIIEDFFTQKDGFTEKIIQYLIEEDINTLFLNEWQMFLISNMKNNVNLKSCIELINKICSDSLTISYKWQIYFYYNFCVFLLNNIKNISNSNLILNCTHKICLHIKNTFGTQKALEFYEVLYNNFEKYLGEERYTNIYYLIFLDGYTENLLHMNSKKAINIYLNELKTLEKNPSLHPSILGKVYNRIYVYYKDKMPENIFHEFLEKSLSLCKKYNLKELEMLNYFDAGTYNLYQKFDIKELTILWERALEIYNKEKFDDAFLFITKKKIQLYFLNKQYKLVKENLDIAQSYLDINKSSIQQSLYFYKAFSLLYVIYELLKEPYNIEIPKRLSIALEYYNQMDNSALFNVYFLYAKYYYFQNDFENMLHYYNLCLNKLEQNKEKIYYDFYKKIIADDLYFKVVNILTKNKNLQIQQIRIENRNTIINQISTIDKETINYYLYDFVSASLVVSEDNKDGYIL